MKYVHKYYGRFTFTAVLLVLFFVVDTIIKQGLDVIKAQAAVAQFSNDPLYFVIMRGIAVREWIETIIFMVLVGILALVWLPVIMKYFKKGLGKK